MMRSEIREKQIGRKTPSSAWKPGQSGNPGGRPKVSAEIRDLARSYGAQAIQRLVALMHSKNESVAVRASEALLDRGYGRPMQAMEMIEKDKAPIPTQIRVEFVKPAERISSSPMPNLLTFEAN